MKQLTFLLLLIIFVLQPCVAQKSNEGFYELKINGISFLTDRQHISKNLGKPLREFAPHYECGYFSDDKDITHYAIAYKGLNWIGNQKDGYQLENVFFSLGSKFVITYKGKKLSSETTQKELVGMKGMGNLQTNLGGGNPDDLIKFIGIQNLKTTSVDLTGSSGDDKYIFYFYKGKLCKIEYWSPC